MLGHAKIADVLLLSLCLVTCQVPNSIAFQHTLNNRIYAWSIYPSQPEFASIEDLQGHLNFLKSIGVNTIVSVIYWSDVEPNERIYRWDYYDRRLDLITRAFSIMIILDSTFHHSAIPKWVLKKHSSGMSVDSVGDVYRYPDYADDKFLIDVTRFYAVASEHLLERYGDRLIAVQPGFQHEYEIKYAQERYHWQTYSEQAKSKFQRWLKSCYSKVEELNEFWGSNYDSFEDIPLPVILHNADGSSGMPDIDSRFTDLMKFREQLLFNYTKASVEAIREKGVKTFAHFAAMFDTLCDSIYCNIMDLCLGLFDVIFVDYNFYDGFQIVDQPFTAGVLVSYAKRLGFGKVVFEAAFERLTPSEDTDNMILASARYALEAGADGLGVVGLKSSDVPVYEFYESLQHLITEVNSRGETEVAIYASKWNYYMWHGDRAFGYDYWRESLYDMYKALFDSGYQVDIIGDASVVNGQLANYSTLYVPNQVVIPSSIKSWINEWIVNGGRAVQDWRLGEFDTFGVSSSGWLNEIFGVLTIEWSQDERLWTQNSQQEFPHPFDRDDVPVQVGLSDFQTCSFQTRTVSYLGPAGNEFSLLLRDRVGLRGTFLVGRRTILMGCQPQIVYVRSSDSQAKTLAQSLLNATLSLAGGQHPRTVDSRNFPVVLYIFAFAVIMTSITICLWAIRRRFRSMSGGLSSWGCRKEGIVQARAGWERSCTVKNIRLNVDFTQRRASIPNVVA